MTGAVNDNDPNRRRSRRPRPIFDASSRQLSFMLPSMARLDLTEEQREELHRLLRGVVAEDRFPLSPRIQRLKAILAKLEPPAAAARPSRHPGRQAILSR